MKTKTPMGSNWIGLVTAAATAALAFIWLKSPYMGILFGFLAWKNYEAMQESRWR